MNCFPLFIVEKDTQTPDHIIPVHPVRQLAAQHKSGRTDRWKNEQHYKLHRPDSYSTGSLRYKVDGAWGWPKIIFIAYLKNGRKNT